MNMMTNQGGTNYINDDVIHHILARLPALSFASAACVDKTWYRVSRQILSRPKLASALSVNPSLVGAVAEVLRKVLCKPIRPDFAIACISEKYGLRLAHSHLTRALGSRTPLVTHISNGVMGLDVLTDELKEVQWEYFDYSSEHPRESNVYGNANEGIVLVVGYLPGLKVEAIPLFHPKRDPTMIDYDIFVREIKAYSAAVSGGEFPSAIIMFGDRKSDVNTIVAKLDHAMPEETAIVGDAGGYFLFNSLNYKITYAGDSYVLDAVALVFAKDKDKSSEVGETKFHVLMAGGLMPFGPRFEMIAIGLKPSTKCSWICAKMEGHDMPLNMEALLETIDETVDDLTPDLYIAVTQPRRYYSIEPESMTLVTSTAFYQVINGSGPCFFIYGVGVRPGDTFLFYHRDMDTAQTTNAVAFDNLEILKEKNCDNDGKKTDNGGVDSVFGGLIFSCFSRGELYFGEPNVDISPFSRNFPGVPVAGVFCKGEIGRVSSSFISPEEHQEQSLGRCCSHASSAVYLVMSYLPTSTTRP